MGSVQSGVLWPRLQLYAWASTYRGRPHTDTLAHSSAGHYLPYKGVYILDADEGHPSSQHTAALPIPHRHVGLSRNPVLAEKFRFYDALTPFTVCTRVTHTLLLSQDLSPKYASALLGITNTAGALPGVLGVTAAGYLLDTTASWALALFIPTAICQLFGSVVYTALASSERQSWS